MNTERFDSILRIVKRCKTRRQLLRIRPAAEMMLSVMQAEIGRLQVLSLTELSVRMLFTPAISYADCVVKEGILNQKKYYLSALLKYKIDEIESRERFDLIMQEIKRKEWMYYY